MWVVDFVIDEFICCSISGLEIIEFECGCSLINF